MQFPFRYKCYLLQDKYHSRPHGAVGLVTYPATNSGCKFLRVQRIATVSEAFAFPVSQATCVHGNVGDTKTNTSS